MTTHDTDHFLLAQVPDYFAVGGLLKATPTEERGERFLYFEASNEDVDHQNEIVLAKALSESADYYLRHGNVLYAACGAFEAGRVWLPESAAWLADYEAELFLFPMAKHDDRVDSTSQYLNWVHKGGLFTASFYIPDTFAANTQKCALCGAFESGRCAETGYHVAETNPSCGLFYQATAVAQ